MRYSPQLDGLRALAAVLVLLFHAKVPGMNSGFLGVDVFFVLSGYLISRLLVDEFQATGRVDVWRFTCGRLKRLYPALLLMLSAYLAIAPIVWPQIPRDVHVRDFTVAGLYLGDYSRSFGAGLRIVSHTWSLGVEQKFYLLAPLLLPLVFVLPRRAGLVALIALFAIATAWRAYNAETTAYLRPIYERFDTHMTGLLLGTALGYANPRLPGRWGWIGILLLAWALITCDWNLKSTFTYGFTIAEMATAMVICAPPAFLGAGLLPWLGRMSYGFYLWHFLAIRVCRSIPELGWPEHLLAGAAVGMLGAVFSYYTIEAPFRRSRSKSSSTQATQTSSAAPTE